MKPVSNEILINQLNWRYATKQFDPKRSIDAADWKTLEQALVLSPSSFGLQPWKFVVVTDPAVKAKLPAISWNQSQVKDASHVVVFAARQNLDAGEVTRFIERTAQVRGVPAASLEPYKQIMLGFVGSAGTGFDINSWSARQVYIAIGNLLTSAAMLGIDACPMEGIDPAKYDELFGLAEKKHHALAVVALGYRSADDKYAGLKKVRYEPNDVFIRS